MNIFEEEARNCLTKTLNDAHLMIFYWAFFHRYSSSRKVVYLKFFFLRFYYCGKRLLIVDRGTCSVAFLPLFLCDHWGHMQDFAEVTERREGGRVRLKSVIGRSRGNH